MKAITLPLLFVTLVGVAHAELKVVPQSSNSTEVIQPESPKPEIPSGKFQAAVQIDGEFVDKVADKVKEIPLKEIKDSVISSAHAAKGLVKSLIAEIPRPAAPTASPSPSPSPSPANYPLASFNDRITPAKDGCPYAVTNLKVSFELAKKYNRNVIVILANDPCHLCKPLMDYLLRRDKNLIDCNKYIICYIDTITNSSEARLFKTEYQIGIQPMQPTKINLLPRVFILDQNENSYTDSWHSGVDQNNGDAKKLAALIKKFQDTRDASKTPSNIKR
jgi:hypothetical protein